MIRIPSELDRPVRPNGRLAWKYGMHWWTGQILALVCGVLMGVEASFAVGCVVFFALSVLVDIR